MWSFTHTCTPNTLPLENTSATIGTSAILSLKHNRLGCNFSLNTCCKLIRIYSYIFKNNVYYTLVYYTQGTHNSV